VYDGQWKDGKQHGKGIFYKKNGDGRKGIWEKGRNIKWLDDFIANPYNRDVTKTDNNILGDSLTELFEQRNAEAEMRLN